MLLTLGYVHLELPGVASLKERRAVLNSLKEYLKKHNLSLLDISGEYAREADIAFAFLSHDGRGAEQYKARIEAALEKYIGHLPYSVEYERF